MISTSFFTISASPQFAHFVRIDGGKWLQHAMNHAHSMLVPDYNSETMLHSNGAVLNVEAGVRAILICTSNLVSLMIARCFKYFS